MNALESLKRFTEIILSENDWDVLNKTVAAMQEFYDANIGMSVDALSEEGILLPSGLAISPFQAAECMKDVPRTVIFIRGVYKAILKLSKNNDCKINIFYAGSGPYAALLTPLTTLFTAEEVGFHLLEINQHSIDSVKKLYSALGLNDYISELVCADAAACMLPADRAMHLVISETMQHALIQEPQAAIMLNLIPQMQDEAIFIPEEIRLDLELTNSADKVDMVCTNTRHIGHLYTIGRKTCEAPAPVFATIPDDTGTFTTLDVFTDITVFEDEKLGPYGCTLNRPQMIGKITERKGQTVKFWYDMTNAPEFRYEWSW